MNSTKKLMISNLRLTKFSKFNTIISRNISNNANYSLQSFTEQYTQIMSQFKDDNLKEYYSRRLEYDINNGKFENLTNSDYIERIRNFENILDVQNRYFIDNTVLKSENNI